jgi:hypothetical protein
MNEQIENANKIGKTIFEHTYDMQQNDWVNYLSNAEFAVNNYENVSINITNSKSHTSQHVSFVLWNDDFKNLNNTKWLIREANLFEAKFFKFNKIRKQT